MDASDVVRDFAARPIERLDTVPELSAQQANEHLAGHPNSIAWLLWHTGRMVDVQLSALNSAPEVWSDHKLADLDRDGIGYGDSDSQARAVQVADAAELAALRGYVRATLVALSDYAVSLSADELDEVIDTSWTPHVTRGVRILSIIDDAEAHLAQVEFVVGALGAR